MILKERIGGWGWGANAGRFKARGLNMKVIHVDQYLKGTLLCLARKSNLTVYFTGWLIGVDACYHHLAVQCVVG